MRLFVTALILICLISLSKDSTAQLDTEKLRSISDFIEETLGGENYDCSSLSFQLLDLSTGKQVLGYDQNRSLSTASTLKLFSTASALEVFGPSYRFETKIALTGEIDAQGTLSGSIYILGGGDPCLGSADFEETYGSFLNDWIEAISAQGIKTINGSVLADVSYFGAEAIPRAWSWGDIGNYYGSGVFGLNVYDNTYNLYFDCPSDIGSPTFIERIEPYIPKLSIINNVRTALNGGDNAYIFGAPGSYQRNVEGTLPAGKKNFKVKGSIPEPGYLLAYQLDSLLRKSGIEISGKPAEGECDSKTYVIYKTLSPPLHEIVKATNEKSVNLYAEALRLHVQKYFDCDPLLEDDPCLSTFWKARGLGSSSLFLEDGSGLSRTNAASASDLSQLLFFMHSKSESAQHFKTSLAISGEEGTLKYFGRNNGLGQRFIGKSGSMNRVRSYAGYLDSVGGKPYAISVIINNYSVSSGEVRKFLEELIVKCAEL
jgi:D-alanyl-D-alanine carboxypeptidase/D-alanyl-D-alanine-endopeptidase (penicillin-binding protein 4)